MKKNIGALLLIVAVFTVTLITGLVMASDVTGAQYKTSVAIGNNGTAATNVYTTFSLNTTDMIEGGMANATAEDIAMVGGGADIAVMPGINGNPWVTYVASIGASGTVIQTLYHGGVTGGEVRYFPDDAGMSANDSATYELGDNFTIGQRGYTNVGASYGVLFRKPGALAAYTSGGDNITLAVLATDSLLEEGGSSQDALYSGSKTRVGQHIDSFNGTVTQVDFVLKKTNVPTGTAYIRIRAETDDSILGTIGTIDVSTLTTSGIWYSFYGTAAVPYPQNIYACVEYDGGDAGNYILVQWDTNGGTDGILASYQGSWSDRSGDDCKIRLYWDYATPVAVVATGLSDGEMLVEGSANVTDLAISIDGVEKDSTSLTANVTNNSENWTFFLNGVMPYVEYQTITVNETVSQNITWQYATVFADSSGNGNDATPTFRTTSSDADVWGYITAQEGIVAATSPTENVSGGWTLLDATPEAPEDLFAEGGDNYSIGGFNFGELITDRATEAGYDPDTWHFLFAYGLATLAMALMYKVSRGGKEGTQKGSLLAATIAGGIVMGIFYRFTTIPGWTIVPYALFALVLIMWRKSPSPVD